MDGILWELYIITQKVSEGQNEKIAITDFQPL